MLLNAQAELTPVYPLIAQQILDDYGVSEGTCLDIGTGPGFLGIELAKITRLEMYFVDISKAAMADARKNVAGCGLDNPVHFLEADVGGLPFDADFADLVISRGSLWFWPDQVKALREIHRVLKKGKVAFVGGGLGRYTPASMRRRLKGKRRKSAGKHQNANFLAGGKLLSLIHATGLKGCRVVSDTNEEDGTWIEIRK